MSHVSCFSYTVSFVPTFSFSLAVWFFQLARYPLRSRLFSACPHIPILTPLYSMSVFTLDLLWHMDCMDRRRLAWLYVVYASIYVLTSGSMNGQNYAWDYGRGCLCLHSAYFSHRMEKRPISISWFLRMNLLLCTFEFARISSRGSFKVPSYYQLKKGPPAGEKKRGEGE